MRQRDVISAYEAIQSNEHKHMVVLDTNSGDDIDKHFKLLQPSLSLVPFLQFLVK